MRVLFHVQGLSGTGHQVRARRIAGALAARHRVHLLDGGRPLPPEAGTEGVHLLEVPRLVRRDGRLAGLDPARDLGEVLEKRRERLEDAVAREAFDLVVIEHFPFSKWELETEVRALLAAARRARPDLRVAVSVRDVLPMQRLPDGVGPGEVGAFLDAEVDLLLVHSDPRHLRLEERHPWTRGVRPPVVHTGLVAPARDGASPGGACGVVVSEGGAGDGRLSAACLEAWALLRETGRAPPGGLRVFLPLRAPAGRREELEARGRELDVPVLPYTGDFSRALAGAPLSVSGAGYNTCAELLSRRVRALVLPVPGISDQPPRAAGLAAAGWVGVLAPEELEPERLATRIREALELPAPEPEVDLDGASRSAELLEGLVGGDLPDLSGALPHAAASDLIRLGGRLPWQRRLCRLLPHAARPFWRVLDTIENRRWPRRSPRILLYRHSSDVFLFLPFLRWLELRFPRLREHFELLLDPLPPMRWTGVGALVPWLQDPVEDWSPRTYRRSLALEEACRDRGLPVVNPVSRLANAAKLEGSRRIRRAGLRTPRGVRVESPEALREAGDEVGFPLVLREDRGHQERMLRLEAPSDLETVDLARFSHPLAQEFVDTRSPDGLHRKYRVLVAGEEAVPIHVHLREDWCVRGSENPRTPELVADELRFLGAPLPLGPALVRARRELGLDLVAFDLSFGADGDPVIWEANPYPCLRFARRRRPYRNPALERGMAAIAGLYLERAGIPVPAELGALRSPPRFPEPPGDRMSDSRRGGPS